MTTFVGTPYTFPNGSTPMNDTNWRTWAPALHAALTGAGLVQTADTGQMNPASAGLPISNTDAGYLIYRFNDSLQGTNPVFLRVMPGHGTNGYTRLRITVGQGSNGAGTITGQTATITCGSQANGAASSSSSVNDYACHTEGAACYFGRVGQADAKTFMHGFSISRTRGTDGSFDGKGLFILATEQDGTNMWWKMVGLRFASPAATYGESNQFCLIPGLPANTALLNGDKQLYPHFANFPDITQAWATFSVLHSELFTAPTTFTATPFGSTPRTFIYLGTAGGGIRFPTNTGDSSFACAFLWE